MADNAFSASELASEEWRDIPGWEGFYQASSLGRIKSLERVVEHPNRWGSISKHRFPEKIRKLTNFKNLYHQVTLSRDDVEVSFYVHRAVALCFLGPCPFNGAQVAHWDGDGKNNRPSNLRWATAKQNAADKERHGTKRNGTMTKDQQRAHGLRMSGLTEENIREIRVHGSAQQDAVMALRFGVKKNAVMNARLRRTFKWVRD